MRTATPSGRSSRLPMPSDTAVRVELPSAARTTSALKSRVSPVLRPDVVQQRGADAGHPAVLGAQRLGDAVAFQHDGARGLGVPGQLLVEAEPGPDQPVLRESRRPPATAVRSCGRRRSGAGPCCAASPRFRGAASPSFWISRTARGVRPSPQTFSRGKAGLLQHRDVNARLGKVVGGGGPGRPRADDQYIHSRYRLSAGPGDVAAQLGHGSGVGGQRRSARGRAG